MAKALGDAFGTGAQVWLNLQAAYRLATSAEKDDAVARRAKLYEKTPIREMQRRGWIEESSNVEILEAQVCQFFDIKKLGDKIPFEHAARKSTDYTGISPSQLAWLIRARNLAKAFPLKTQYSDRLFDSIMIALYPLCSEPEEIRHVPRMLSHYGIRFLVVEHLPKTRIDGACFWLDKHSPVIALSLRYDRVDWFWHSLGHELKHVRDRDGEKKAILETLLVGEDAQPVNEKPKKESQADKFAVEFLVDQNKLQDFINRHHPLYSKREAIGFSRRIEVHPGIVVGQLQYLGKIPYSNLRGVLVKVRDIITATALTDGWGRTVSL